ncbi:MAG: hypothetical protein ACI841_000138 [Planctomycetota bacterium]|jgi:hypothetical protein
MTGSKQSTLLGVLVLLLASIVGAGLWFTGGSNDGAADEGLGPAAAAPFNGPLSPGAPLVLEGIRKPTQIAPGEQLATTVIWPLDIELSLIESATYDASEGLAPIGSGAHATLTGSIFNASGEGAGATIEFVAGPNMGRVLRCDAQGKYGASNLYPGISIVSVKTAFGNRAKREVRLASRKTQPMTIGFGSLSTVYGKVVDKDGEPITQAVIEVDGHETLTDELGEFVVRDVASGSALAIVRKPGYALYRETVPVPRGRVVPKDRMTFRLEPGADLEVTVGTPVGAAGPAKLFVLPVGQPGGNSVRGQRTFPWHEVSPVDIYPGGSVLIEGLPEGRVSLMLFHAGAVAKPSVTTKKVIAGRQNQSLLSLHPAPQITGFVKRDGRAVDGARVVLETADRGATTEDLFGGLPMASMMVLPHLPVSRQEIRTDRKGLFMFTSYPGIDRFYLKATSTDGRMRATQVVEAGASQLELNLEPIKQGDCELVLELPDRFQPLPISIRIDGTPRDVFLLDAGDDLVVGDLDPGTWRLDVKWHGEALVRASTLKLTSKKELELHLPTGAIEGQTIEERKRAGL